MRGRAVAIAAACMASMTLLPGLAQGHVSLHPNSIPAGAFVTLNVRVPGEQPNAYAYKVAMLVPNGFTEIDTQNVPGWSVKETMRKLSTPVQTAGGPVSEEVSEIVWTGDRTRLGRLENGQFIQFPLSIAMPDDLAGQTLAFKTVEYYSDGKAVHWIGAPSAEFPAPTLQITNKGGVIQDVASGEAGPAPGEGQGSQRAASGSGPAPGGGSAGGVKATTAASGASKGLGIAALILGALGLLAGVCALVLARRGPNRGASQP